MDEPDNWPLSDTKYAFMHTLEERSLLLVKGKRVAFVAVDICSASVQLGHYYCTNGFGNLGQNTFD